MHVFLTLKCVTCIQNKIPFSPKKSYKKISVYPYLNSELISQKQHFNDPLNTSKSLVKHSTLKQIIQCNMYINGTKVQTITVIVSKLDVYAVNAVHCTKIYFPPHGL